MIGCNRCNLLVIADERGLVVGRLLFEDNGDLIGCSKMGIGGKAIPPINVGSMSSNALFVLLVEKDATFMRLVEDKFYDRFPCIIIGFTVYGCIITLRQR
jgi:meiotic recombination protein SPO11